VTFKEGWLNLVVFYHLSAYEILPDKRSGLIRGETTVYKTLNTKKKKHNSHESKLVGFGLVWFMVFNATFNNISVVS
jgi:hypothetical protein